MSSVSKFIKSPEGMGIAGTLLGGPILGASAFSTGKSAEAAEEAAGIQASAADRAAALQAETAEKSLGFQREQFEASKELLTPFATGGQDSFRRQQALSGALGPGEQETAFEQFRESPGVAFQRKQGMRGIGAGLSAAGGLGGGSRLKAISEFNQGLALQDFGNQFNRLGAVTQTGLAGAGALSGAGQNFAGGASQTLSRSAAGQGAAIQNAAAARASGVTGRAQAFQSGLSDLFQLGGFAAGRAI